LHSPIGLVGWILDHDIRSYQMIVCVFYSPKADIARCQIAVTV